MKNVLKLFVITLVLISTLPCLSFAVNGNKVPTTTTTTIATTTHKQDNPSNVRPTDIKLYLTKEHKVVTLSAEEYVAGCVLAEIGNTYHLEAVKAQAVACYTYALYCKSQGGKKELSGAYLSDDASKYQAYKSLNELKSEYGKAYSEYTKTTLQAVEATKGEVLTYEGKPILPAYHNSNSGFTQSCEDVWGGKRPYLKSVVSTGDTVTGGTVFKHKFTPKQVLSKLKKAYNNKEFDASLPIEVLGRNQVELVTKISAFGRELTGVEFRKALGLESAVFTVKRVKGYYTFTCSGFGHGVGMSQVGAQYMALQGANYREILKHYYSGVEITTDFRV